MGQYQGKGHTFHNCRDVKSLGEGNGNPLQYSCLENPHGWRSLVGYSPWGRKESDTTERLHFTFILQLKKKVSPRHPDPLSEGNY